MKIGLYIISSLLFIIGVAVATYMIYPGSFSFDIFDIHLPKIPVAIWVAIPVALLAIFSVLHMVFYGTKVFFANKKWKSDANKLEDAVYFSLIKEPTTISYSHPELEKSASILSFSTIDSNSTQETSSLSQKLKDALKVILKIKNGEYIDLKKEKFAKHLSEDNEIVKQNIINRLNADPKFALKVLDFKDKYDNEIVSLALDKLIQTQDFYTIKKYGKEIKKERFFKLLKRVEDGEEIGFNKEMLSSFLNFYNLDCKDYYKIAQITLKAFDPDSNLEVFRTISKKDEDALPAYLFLLFKYEMIQKAKEVLDEHPEDEFKAFRAFYILKKGKHNYKLSDIVNEKNICK